MTKDAPKRDGRRRSHNDGSLSLAQEARNLIIEDIITCRLRSGEMVQLASLSNNYAMSKTPIREALMRLQDEGLVEALPYRGYMVSEIDLGEINEIYYMRHLIEGAMSELAATHITEEELKTLTRLSAPETVVMNLEYDTYARSFHSTIAKASRNTRLEDAFKRTYNDMRRLQYAGIGRPRPDEITHEHEAILDALRSHDADKARQLMEDHIDSIRNRALST